MNKKSPSPPMIILLDLLFIIVFILIIEQTNETKIYIPKDELFKNAILVYKNKDENLIIDKNNGEIINTFLNKSTFSYYKKCTTQCEKYKSLNKDMLYIYFPDDLFNTISKLTFIASSSKYNCTNLKFYVNIDGKIDYKKMIDNNECFNNIQGINFLVDN